MEHKMSRETKLTTQLPETLRHMPDLQLKIKITQEIHSIPPNYRFYIKYTLFRIRAGKR